MLNTSHFRKYKEDNVLPNYIASVRQNNKRIGFTVAGVKLKDTKKLYTRKFTDQYKTLEEKYNLALEHLNQLENKEYQ
jgi:nucleoside-triphosphatase THEP1